ncbi:alpha/beta fold hydrolase [Thermocatellispora tengchongensis]|uniref:alpha/beta fold hydrolase n=1 Tax=Thermocatellispora tengchongensis TaxID=1073253 RepID=UPI00364106BF
MPYLTWGTDANVYYEEFGAGAPILFVSAGLATHDEWEHQVAPLARDHRTVTFDWPGVGASDKPNLRYGGDLLVDSMKALIETLELERCTVVAHGIGAHGALLAAERFPALVHKLVLVGAAPGTEEIATASPAGSPRSSSPGGRRRPCPPRPRPPRRTPRSGASTCSTGRRRRRSWTGSWPGRCSGPCTCSTPTAPTWPASTTANGSPASGSRRW